LVAAVAELAFATGVRAEVFVDCAVACVISMVAASATGRQATRIHRVARIIRWFSFARGWLAQFDRRAGQG
jgi:hypothetical protein